MNWFRHKPTQRKYVEAAVQVATNLYLHTIPGAEDAPAPLQFSLPDSRFRYLIFCLNAVVAAALAYDEKKRIQPEALMNGCLKCAEWIATENPGGYIEDSANPEDATAYFEEFAYPWGRCVVFEKARSPRHAEVFELISSMIHTTESNLPADETDKRRLLDLPVEISCRLPAVHGALVELANRKS